jgi:tRNA-2-methylthio-N6-dimethylallyladenosine synthase
MSEARTFAIRTFGCQMNEHDSERLAGMLTADGLVRAENDDDADVIVLNTCCIRENADNKLYGTLGQLKSLKDARPGLQIAVGGCLAQKDRGQVLERAGWVDVVFGTHNLASAPELLRRSLSEGSLVEILDAPDPESVADMVPALNAVRELPWAAWMTIQTGCDNSCAFCIVPSVRGGEISRSMQDLLVEANALASQGVTEITVLGQNVNSYGRDITKRRPLFAQLLRELGAVPGIERVRFTSPHPKDLRAETIAAMAETASVCNQLHLPVQSGSDEVLSAMRRGYTAQRYLEKLRAARASIDDLAVTTDFIVGFPGETEAQFDDTLALAAEAQFDSAYTFIFSARPGTRAAEMTERFIAADVVADRFQRLCNVLDRSGLKKHEERVGRVEEALVEGPSKRDPDVLSARTRQGKLVHFRAPAPGLRPGALASVTITHGAKHHLLGDYVSTLRGPKHRSRIPLLVS